MVGVGVAAQATAGNPERGPSAWEHYTEGNFNEKGMNAYLVFWGSCFGTIDKRAKYRISGASATPERKEHATQGPTATVLHPTRATM